MLQYEIYWYRGNWVTCLNQLLLQKKNEKSNIYIFLESIAKYSRSYGMYYERISWWNKVKYILLLRFGLANVINDH